MKRYAIVLAVITLSMMIPLVGAKKLNTFIIPVYEPENNTLELSVIQDNMFYIDRFFSGFIIKEQSYIFTTYDIDDNVLFSLPYFVGHNNRYNFTNDITRVTISQGEKIYVDKEVSFCNFNSVCEPCKGPDCQLMENFFTCGECESGGKDYVCDLHRDLICDPDCEDFDGDCEFCTLKECYYDDSSLTHTSCIDDFQGMICEVGDGCRGKFTYADDSGSRCCIGSCVTKEELNPAPEKKQNEKKTVEPKVIEEKQKNKALIYGSIFALVLGGIIGVIIFLKKKGLLSITMVVLGVSVGSFMLLQEYGTNQITGLVVGEGGDPQTLYCEGADLSLIGSSRIANCGKPYVDESDKSWDKMLLIAQALERNGMDYYDPILVASQFMFESGCGHPKDNGQGIGQVTSCAHEGKSICTIEENINYAVQHIKGGLEELKNYGVTDPMDQFMLNQFIYNRGRGTFLGFDYGGTHLTGTLEYIEQGDSIHDAMVKSCYNVFDKGLYGDCGGLDRDGCCVQPGGAGYYKTVLGYYEDSCDTMGGKINTILRDDAPKPGDSGANYDPGEGIPQDFTFEDTIGFYYLNPAIRSQVQFDPAVYNDVAEKAQELVAACEGEVDLHTCILDFYESEDLSSLGWNINGCEFNQEILFIPPEDIKERTVRFCIQTGSEISVLKGNEYVMQPTDIRFALFFAPPEPACSAEEGRYCGNGACCSDEASICCATFAVSEDDTPDPDCGLEGFYSYRIGDSETPNEVTCRGNPKTGITSADFKEDWASAYVVHEGERYECNFDRLYGADYVFECTFPVSRDNVVCLGKEKCTGIPVRGAPQLVENTCKVSSDECSSDGTFPIDVPDGDAQCPFNVNLFYDEEWSDRFCQCGTEVFTSIRGQLPSGAPSSDNLFCCGDSWSATPCIGSEYAPLYSQKYMGTYPECTCGNGGGELLAGTIFSPDDDPCEDKYFWSPYEGGKCCRYDGTANMEPASCPGGQEQVEVPFEPIEGTDWETEEEECETVGDRRCVDLGGAYRVETCVRDDADNVWWRYMQCINGCSEEGGSHCKAPYEGFEFPGDYACSDDAERGLEMLEYFTGGHASGDDAYPMTYIQQSGSDAGSSVCIDGTFQIVICDEHLYELCNDGLLSEHLCDNVPTDDFDKGLVQVGCGFGCGIDESEGMFTCLAE